METRLAKARYQASSDAVTNEVCFVTAPQRLASVDDEFVIPVPRGCLQQLRRGRIELDLLPQPVHQLLQELAIARITVTPDLDQQPSELTVCPAFASNICRRRSSSLVRRTGSPCAI